jgi:DNA-binding MarR family transcriptional regulator
LLAQEAHVGTALTSHERESIIAMLTMLLRRNAEPSPMLKAAPDGTGSLMSSWVRAFPDLDRWLVYFLGAIPLLSSRVDRESRKVLGALGLTPNGFGLLCALRRAGAPFRLAPSDLYHVVVLSPAGVAGQLDKMERAGLIERSNDPEDGRLNRASLTKRGQKVVNNTIGDFVLRHDWLLKPLSEKQREELTALLGQILTSVERRREELPGARQIRSVRGNLLSST